MQFTLRVWLLSLIIQPICFGPLGIFVIPIEIIFSIPGIILFGLIVQLLLKAGSTFTEFIIILIIAAGILGFLSSYLFLTLGDETLVSDKEEQLLFSLPAAIAGILAVAFSYKKAKKLFEPEIETKTNEGYYEY